MSTEVTTGNPNPLYGSDHLALLLREMGVGHVFINPGSSFRGLHDSLVNFTGNHDPEIVLTTHEMIAVAMAHGYAKATGGLGVSVLHNLVGLLNGSMSVFNAFCDQTPLLILGGSGPADPVERRFIDWAHTANTQGDIVRQYVKWVDEPATLDASFNSILEARRRSLTAPCGPTYVSIDAGHQEHEAPDAVLPSPGLACYQPALPSAPSPDAVERICHALLNARMPLIFGGRFGIDPAATAPLARLVELLGAAYQDDRNITCMPTLHQQNLNGDRTIRSEADVILALDCQDVTAITKGYGLSRSAILNGGAGTNETMIIDISLNDYFGGSWSRFGGPTPPTDIKVNADALLSIRMIADRLETMLDDGARKRIADRVSILRTRQQAIHETRLANAKARWNDSPITLARLTHELYEAVKDEDWLLAVRNHRSWQEGLWPHPGSGRYLGGDGGGGVGYGPGATAGAALALKDSGKLVVGLIGDGDFLMAPGAIWSAAAHRAPMLLVIANNSTWGNDELHQREVAEQRGRPLENAHVGQRMADPSIDIAGVARSMGAFAPGPVTDPAKLSLAFAEAIEAVRAGKVAVVEVITALD